MVVWKLAYTKQAQKDAQNLSRSNLKPHADEILNILKDNPFQNPPPYEKLVGDLSGAYSRRINIQHRIVYQALEDIKTVKVLRMWTHYVYLDSIHLTADTAPAASYYQQL